MNSIQFIPKNQKSINQIQQNKTFDISANINILLASLFIIYVLTMGSVYWVTIINEESRLKKSISIIDNENSKYYPKGDLEQNLFNLNDLIDNSYNPIPVIKNIESAYIDKSRVKNFVYNKINKSISLSMTAQSIVMITDQVQKLKSIKEISSVDFKYAEVGGSTSESIFNITIKLN